MRDRQRDRQRDRDRETVRETERETETDRERQRDKEYTTLRNEASWCAKEVDRRGKQTYWKRLTLSITIDTRTTWLQTSQPQDVMREFDPTPGRLSA